jgi:hypothetical protein
MNPTLATLLTVSVTGIAATLVLLLIFFIPVLRQVRRTAHDAEKLIDSVLPMLLLSVTTSLPSLENSKVSSCRFNGR